MKGWGKGLNLKRQLRKHELSSGQNLGACKRPIRTPLFLHPHHRLWWRFPRRLILPNAANRGPWWAGVPVQASPTLTQLRTQGQCRTRNPSYLEALTQVAKRKQWQSYFWPNQIKLKSAQKTWTPVLVLWSVAAAFDTGLCLSLCFRCSHGWDPWQWSCKWKGRWDTFWRRAGTSTCLASFRRLSSHRPNNERKTWFYKLPAARFSPKNWIFLIKSFENFHKFKKTLKNYS